jgi:branched-chain amino acid aminotransferase
MIVFINDGFVPEANATVSIFDRGFLYGDSLFEGIRIHDGKLFRWHDHMDRLEQGQKFLRIAPPAGREKLQTITEELIRLNQFREGIVRVTVSRGPGPRGYSPKTATRPTLLLTLHPLPELSEVPKQFTAITSSITLREDDPLAHFKNGNRLLQVLARAEADERGADEAILLSTAGHIAEATTSNVFWISGDHVFTPPLKEGILPGVTRKIIFELCAGEIELQEARAGVEALKNAQGVFLTMTSLGIVEVISLDGVPLATSPLTLELAKRLRELVRRELVKS